MRKVNYVDGSSIDAIVHLSDNSQASHAAFAHSLKIAISAKASLTLLHVDTDPFVVAHWWKPPPVRKVLGDWGLLERDVPRDVVFKELGIAIRKVSIAEKSALQGISAYLDRHAADLVVLSTEGRMGLPRWLKPSVAEQVAHRTEAACLFVPKHSRHFVHPGTGELSIDHVLMPVDHHPNPQAAVCLTKTLLGSLDLVGTTIETLHVGPNPPTVADASPQQWNWKHGSATGGIVDAILSAATARSTDLVVMPTQGRHGLLDAMHGSTTEQVVRAAPCPVLAIPLPA